MLLLSWHRRDVYFRLMRVDRPIGTLLVAWPTLWALWLAAGGLPPVKLIAVFLLGAFLMRSAGCVINDYADRDFDPLVARTRHRPLATGEIPSAEAIQLFMLLGFLAAGLLVFTNKLTVLLAPVAVLLASAYPFMKRFTQLPQFFLGLAFSWAVPMAFAAVTDSLPQLAWVLLLAVIFWVLVYDTFYAMVDKPDDIKAGIKSTAILFGRRSPFITACLQFLFLATLVYAGLRAQLGSVYFLSLIITAGLCLYQQFLIRSRKPENYFAAFMNNNYVGLTIFLGISLDLSFG